MNPEAENHGTTPASFRIQLRELRKSFGGVEVLHGVNLEVRGGRTLVLLGENGAGKSTLVRLLSGAMKPDSGQIVIDGHGFAALDPSSARAHGVRMIYQELMDAPDLSVAENISLGRWSNGRAIIRWDAIRATARRILDELGVDLDLDSRVGDLSVGERQVVEIARALADDARCLILDEPTAALSSEETSRLFSFVKDLRRRGVAIVYITHRLSEVAEIGSDVIVLRDGQIALQGEVDSLQPDEIIAAMTGNSLSRIGASDAERAIRDEVSLSFAEAASEPVFSAFTLDVHAGEVVALYGKVGSGASEVLNVVFGRRRLTGGSVTIDDSAGAPADPRAAIRMGVGYVPADRQREGGLMSRPVRENLCAPSWPVLARRGFLSHRTESRLLGKWRDALNIRMSRAESTPLMNLSGGNQQKVILARWFECGSRILCLDEPTRGVDVHARADIYSVIESRARNGCAIVLVTSDTDEAVRLADRVVVFVRGRAAAVLSGKEISAERLTAVVSR